MYKLLPILLFAIGLAVTTDEIYDNSYALIIGIDKYKNKSLDYAVKDAESVANLLKDKFNFPQTNIKTLLNDEATFLNIRNSLSEIASSAKENDRVLIYFAGHGITDDLPDGGEMGYLLPIDGKVDNLFATSIPMDDIKRISSISKSKHMLFLIDACYGGLSAVGARGLDARTTPNYIDKITQDKARQIITAGGRDEEVLEKSEWGHSAFTMNLIRALEDGNADYNDDGYITADELGLFLKEKVTIDSENKQTPQSRRFTSHEGEFVFINNAYIKKQIINITPGAENDDIRVIDELRDKIASLEKQFSKPVKFIKGCTDSKALNYNPKANLDDNSCFVLPPNSAHIKLSEFNDRDSTLNVTLRLGVGSYGINQLNFSTEGFKILEFISGEVIDNNYTIDSAIVEGINNYAIVSDKNSTGLINPTYSERILFTAKIQPGIMVDKICLTNIYISNIPEGKISIEDCLLLPKKMRPWSFGNSLSLFDNGNGTWNVMFSSDGDIGGFQFSIDGVSDISASHGMAGRSGFMVSASNDVVIGFSISGDKIPAGEGVLTRLELSGIPVGISGIVVANPSGNTMDFRYKP